MRKLIRDDQYTDVQEINKEEVCIYSKPHMQAKWLVVYLQAMTVHYGAKEFDTYYTKENYVEEN